MKRGTIVTVALGGGLAGKPRPAVVVQDELIGLTETILVIPLTSDVQQDMMIRPLLTPDDANGLRAPSSAMTSRIMPVRQIHIGPEIGILSNADMARIDASLMLMLGLAR